MAGAGGDKGRAAPPAGGLAQTGSVEQRVDRWAAMLDDAVKLLNQVMAEVKETGHTDHDDSE